MTMRRVACTGDAFILSAGGALAVLALLLRALAHRLDVPA